MRLSYQQYQNLMEGGKVESQYKVISTKRDVCVTLVYRAIGEDNGLWTWLFVK